MQKQNRMEPFLEDKKKLNNVRTEKKKLRSRWIEVNKQERERTNILYEKVKKKHWDLLRKKRIMNRKREKRKTGKKWKIHSNLQRGVFTESNCGPLKFTKEENENHLKETYSDPKREEKLSYIKKLKRPTAHGVAFNMSDIKAKEIDEFIKKSRSKSSPGNDGKSYKVSKKCPRLRIILFLLLRKIGKEMFVADRWEREEKSEKLGKFRSIPLLNI